VALQAALAGFYGRELGKTNDFVPVATTFHVSRTRPVTVFAAVATLLCEGEMWSPLEVLRIDIVMAVLASVRSDIRCAGNSAWHDRDLFCTMFLLLCVIVARGGRLRHSRLHDQGTRA
jgi:hypothetical protein